MSDLWHVSYTVEPFNPEHPIISGMVFNGIKDGHITFIKPENVQTSFEETEFGHNTKRSFASNDEVRIPLNEVESISVAHSHPAWDGDREALKAGRIADYSEVDEVEPGVIHFKPSWSGGWEGGETAQVVLNGQVTTVTKQSLSALNDVLRAKFRVSIKEDEPGVYKPVPTDEELWG